MLIVEVGVRDGGRSALHFAQDANNEIYAIEPVAELVEQLCSHCLPNIHVFWMDLGEDAGNSIGLDAFMQQNGLTEVDLLRINTQCHDLGLIQGLREQIHCIKKLQLQVPLVSGNQDQYTKTDVIDYLMTQGFRLLQSLPQIDHRAETLEFIRVNRYSFTNRRSEYFDVQVPYVGAFRTPPQDQVGLLLEEGVFEGPEQAFLWLYLRSGDTFFDCGTHTGLFSCIAAKKLENHGRIIGFDPNPLCHQLYIENLHRLGCNCFTAFNIGLADTEGSAELLLGKPGRSAFSTFAKGAIEQNELSQERIVVNQRSLDQVIEDIKIDQVDLAKLDVEGWEAFVLQGAKQSIQAEKFPLWMIEFTEANAISAGSSTKELRDLLESLGYTLCCFDATHFRLVPEPQRLRYAYANLFAVRDLNRVNDRLATADPQSVEIARDIIARWDASVSTENIYHHIAHEKQVSHHLNLQVQQLQDQLRQTQAALEQCRQQTAVVQDRVKAMESSKFWQLRTIWFRFKRTLGLPVND